MRFRVVIDDILFARFSPCYLGTARLFIARQYGVIAKLKDIAQKGTVEV